MSFLKKFNKSSKREDSVSKNNYNIQNTTMPIKAVHGVNNFMSNNDRPPSGGLRVPTKTTAFNNDNINQTVQIGQDKKQFLSFFRTKDNSRRGDEAEDFLGIESLGAKKQNTRNEGLFSGRKKLSEVETLKLEMANLRI